MGVLIQMVYSACIKTGGASFKPMNYVSLFEKKLGKISSVLTGDACDKCHFSHFKFFDYKKLYVKLSFCGG
jgi:hypothetical protein